MSSVKTVAATDSTFAKEVLESPVPVLVDFWAEWCGPCRAIAPVVDELADAYAGRVRFVKVDVDENPDTAAKYAVRSIPSLMFFKGGAIKDQLVGALPNLRKEIANRLDTLLT